MTPPHLAKKVLARASAKLGGVEALAARLKISQRILTHYIEGNHAVPDDVFLLAIDVVLEDPPRGDQ